MKKDIVEKESQLWKDWQNCVSYFKDQDFYNNIEKCVNFYEGNHWGKISEKTKDLPRVTINMIEMTVNSKVAGILANPIKTTFYSDENPARAEELTRFNNYITKEMKFDEKTENGEIHQTLENCVLTTEINRMWEQGGIKNTIKSVQTEELPEGTIIIWSELQGYIVPNIPMYKLKDLEKEIADIKEIYKDNTDINPVGMK